MPIDITNLKSAQETLKISMQKLEANKHSAFVAHMLSSLPKGSKTWKRKIVIARFRANGVQSIIGVL